MTDAAYRQGRTYLPPPQWNPLAPMRDPAHPTEVPAGNWGVAVFDNRFPSLAPPLDPASPLPVLPVPASHAGRHGEVVVFTQDPGGAVGRLAPDHLELALQVWSEPWRRRMAPAPLPMGAGPQTLPSVPVAVPVPVPVPVPAPPPVMVAPVPAPSPMPAMTAPGALSARNNAPMGAMASPPGAAAPQPGRMGAASAPVALPVRGLPEQAPPLVLGGSVWSADPRLRCLLVNGLPLPEGADAAEGVRIESIGRDQAVLGFRGQRYTVSF